ncbi:MAG: hypothetical protein ACE5JC_07515 [Candidatus Zixiibacteriota bacterium]
MKKLLTVAALLAFVATMAYAFNFEATPQEGTDARMRVCDNYGYVYDVRVNTRNGTISGSVQTTGCGVGTLSGTFWNAGPHYFCFEIQVTLNDPNCCPGYTMTGCWDTHSNTGFYDWVNWDPCTGSGSSDIWQCRMNAPSGGTPSSTTQPGCDMPVEF